MKLFACSGTIDGAKIKAIVYAYSMAEAACDFDEHCASLATDHYDINNIWCGAGEDIDSTMVVAIGEHLMDYNSWTPDSVILISDEDE